MASVACCCQFCYDLSLPFASRGNLGFTNLAIALMIENTNDYLVVWMFNCIFINCWVFSGTISIENLYFVLCTELLYLDYLIIMFNTNNQFLPHCYYHYNQQVSITITQTWQVIIIITIIIVLLQRFSIDIKPIMQNLFNGSYQMIKK